MSMARILVVDDEPFNLDIVAEYLDEMDFDLVMVESGEAAWDELTRPDSSFDLVLLDRMMPGMDGIQVLKKIKGDAELRGIPVIMQTAATSPEQVREGLAAGAFYYLTKPFEGEALQTIIRSALDDMRTRRELNANLADHAVALSCITEGEFFVRTLDEARKLAAFIALLGPQPETLAMGLSELLVNGVEHGNLGIDFAEKSRLRETDCWGKRDPAPYRAAGKPGQESAFAGARGNQALGVRDHRRRGGLRLASLPRFRSRAGLRAERTRHCALAPVVVFDPDLHPAGEQGLGHGSTRQ